MIDLVAAPRDIHLYFNREVKEVPEEIKALLKTSCRKIVFCTNWSELGEFMKNSPKSICVHANELKHTSSVEIVNMIKTLAKLVEVENNISISVGVDHKTSFADVKEFQKSDINCIIPSYQSFGVEETVKALKAQWHGIPYWPKHIIDQLPGAKPTKLIDTNINQIKLTTRQNQILNLVLERGSSNKIIARTLNISESTVKLHLGHIFKKFGVKNRTQLAVFARK